MAFYDLADLKDDIGIAADDVSQDAWLTRRVEGVLSRMSTYCQRYIGPVIEFVDDWRLPRPESNVHAYHPYREVRVFHLKNYPVASITSAKDGGAILVPEQVVYEPVSGLLMGYGDEGLNYFTNPTVGYTAGWATMPADLYEIMVGVIRSLWTMRANEVAGLSVGGLMPNEINISDVGNVKLTDGGTGFDNRTGDAADPYLGPYTYILDSYMDRRGTIGGRGLPVTSTLVVAP